MSVPARFRALREEWEHVDPPRQPVLLINPRSGDGKAVRAALADRARERGVEPVVLGPRDDLATLVATAVDEGADALGMAGGDGSLATVAAAAAEHDLPFICLPAGTRNHFALDLGIVRHDLIGALDAFTEALERRIDIAEVNGRPFLNNVSLGIYGDAVQRSAYRDAKLRTMLDTLHEVLSSAAPTPELLVTDDLARPHTSPLVVLVSNNEYALDQPLARGSRLRLDSGRLGIIVLDRPGAERPRFSRGARAQLRSRPSRPCPQASTARPSLCSPRSTSHRAPLRCASASHATTRAPRPRPCSRQDNRPPCRNSSPWHAIAGSPRPHRRQRD